MLKAASNQPCSCINIATRLIGHRGAGSHGLGRWSPRLRGKGCVNRVMIQVPACTSSPAITVHTLDIEQFNPRYLHLHIKILREWQSNRSVVSIPGIARRISAQSNCPVPVLHWTAIRCEIRWLLSTLFP